MTATARGEAEVHRHGEDRPRGGYVLMMAVFTALIGGAAGLIAAGRRLPTGFGPWDLLLIYAKAQQAPSVTVAAPVHAHVVDRLLLLGADRDSWFSS